MAARQVYSVIKLDGAASNESVKAPSVFLAPIRPDIVRFVHTNMAKNRRQAYAVAENAGHQHSAESWGTGRAVARIPRVGGGGTGASGQGAFGNMCRGGRMFAPTKTWRKWHRKINTNQKRYAVASALAASALPALVMARGHRIEQIAEVPLIVDNAIESVSKTKDAVKVLTALAAFADVAKAAESRKIRRGVGKMRNRRHVMRRGPLVVYSEDKGVTRAFRNLPGVEICHVDRLNLLQLAPGGHLGRLVIWSKGAVARLDQIWGSWTRESVQKTGYTLPRAIISNSDLTRLINSDEVQSKVRPAKKDIKRRVQKKNPLTNLGVRVRLNPYAAAARSHAKAAEERQARARAAAVEAKKKGVARALTPAQKAERAANKKHGKKQSANYQNLISAGKSLKEFAADVAAKVAAAQKAIVEKKEEKKAAAKAPAKKGAAPAAKQQAAAAPAKAEAKPAAAAKADAKPAAAKADAKPAAAAKGADAKPADKGGKGKGK